MEYKNKSIETLYKHFSDIMNNVDGKYTKKISRTFTDDWNSLLPELRKQISDYASNITPGRTAKDNSIADSFNKILRNQAVDDYWANERKLLQKGLATYNWDATQQDDILNNLIPKYVDPNTGKKHVFQGHHMADVHTNPEYAGDFRNIQPLYGQAQTQGTLHNLAHKGNSKNTTFGYYDNITREMYNFPDSMIEKMFGGVPRIGDTNMFNGFPPIIELTDISVGNGNSIPNTKLLDRMESVFPGFDRLTNDQKILVQRYESLWKEFGGNGGFIDFIFDNDNVLKKNEAYLDDISEILVGCVNFDSFEIPQKHKDLLKVSNLDEITSKKLKQLIYMREVKKVDPNSIDIEEFLKDCKNSPAILDEYKQMSADDLLEFMAQSIEAKDGEFVLKIKAPLDSTNNAGIDVWITKQKINLISTIRKNPELVEILGKGLEKGLDALSLFEFAGICVDIYTGIKNNSMTYEEAGKKVFDWGVVTVGCEVGALVCAGIAPPIGPIVGGIVGGTLAALFGEFFYDDLCTEAFNYWDRILSDGNHFMEGKEGNDVFNFAHGELNQFAIRELFTNPDETEITFNIESKGGNDYVAGYQNSDTLIGGSGNDMLIGCGGDDVIYGDKQQSDYKAESNEITYDDVIYGGSGNDKIHGGTGNDIIYGDGIRSRAEITDNDIFKMPKLKLDEKWMDYAGLFEVFNPYSSIDYAYDDTLLGEDGTDYIFGGQGNDIINGGNDADIIYGEGGNDNLYGDEGNDFIDGGEGDNYIEGGTGDDCIVSGSGNDTIYAMDGKDTVIVESGRNYIVGGINDDYICGGSGNDTIYGDRDDNVSDWNDGNDLIYGGAGNDTIHAGSNDDFIDAGDGDDRIFGDSGNNEIHCGSGDDKVYGGEDSDIIYGGNGIDEIFGGDRTDKIYGENNNDKLHGEYGDDEIYGGLGDDYITGGSGRDELYGEAGDDSIYGDDSGDILDGGSGNDKLRGGDGDESYFFGYGYDNDTIYDLSGINHIELGYIDMDAIKLEMSEDKDDIILSLYDLEEGYVFDGDDYQIDYNIKTGDSLCIEKFDECGENTYFWIDDESYQIIEENGELVFKQRDIPDNGGSGSNSSGTSGDIKDLMIPNMGNKYDESGKAQPPRDPLVIDMNFDGVYTTDVENGVYFDIDNNGFAEKTEWIDGIDGFLVYNRDNDERITNGSELFSDQVILSNGTKSTHGFDVLKTFDSDNNGIIDKNDTQFADLRLWIDKDHDGITWLPKEGKEDNSELKELYTLDEKDIVSIDTNYYFNYSGRRYVSEVQFKNGYKTTISEHWFDAVMSDSQELNTENIDNDLTSFGNLHSISYAIEHDTDGYLQNLIDKFRASVDYGEKRILTKKILYRISGAEGIDIGSRGGAIDARDLHVIETIMGVERFIDNDGFENPNVTAASILKSLYNDFETLYFNLINLETNSSNYLEMIREENDENGNIVLDLSTVKHELDDHIECGYDIEEILCSVNSFLSLYDMVNSTNYSIDFKDYYSDYKYMFEQYSRINVVFGDEKSNSLFGTLEQDTIDGAAGDDLLYGGKGNDTYIFGKESGNDTIYDNSGVNRIVFKDFVSTDMKVMYPTENYNAIFVMNSTGQTLTFRNFWESTFYRNFVLEFSDGIVMNADDENSPFCHVVGTENDDKSIKSLFDKTVVEGLNGNDVINDCSGNNKLYGGNGNDTINANNGDDYIDGGAGDDILNGGSGNDTFVFGKESGNDTIYDYSGINRIVFKDFVSTDMLPIYPTENTYNAILVMKSTGQTLTFKDFCKSTYYRNFVLEFSDGIVMNADDENSPFCHVVGTENDDKSIKSLFDKTIVEGLNGNDVINDCSGNNKLYGGNGNDTINANSGDDYIEGGAGDDSLYGGNGNDYIDGGIGNDYIDGGIGNDTYVFGKESGDDIIYDASGTNRIVFKDFVSTDMIVSYPIEPEYNAILTILSTGQTLTFKDFCKSTYYRNFVLEFSDGIVMNADDENSPFCHVVGTENNDKSIKSLFDKTIVEGLNGNDVINDCSGNNKLYGGNGNDIINANSGDDYLDGGAGDDLLYGENGNDTYIFGKESGDDIIYDFYGPNRVVFKDFVSTDMIVSYPTEPEYNAILTILSTGQTLTFKDFRRGTSYRNFVLEFADGKVMNVDDENSPFCHVIGTENDDTEFGSLFNKTTIEAFDGNDVINDNSGSNKLYGGNGNDTINANNGDDYIDGGAGDDSLAGGYGNDTYIFGENSGNDIIYDGVGTNRIIFKDFISIDMIVSYPTENKNNAILVMKSTGQTLTFENFCGSSTYRNFVLEFADGTVMNADDENSPFCHVKGTENDDVEFTSVFNKTTIEAFDGNDVINDNSGSNKLYGGNGNDTINANNGDDYIDGGAGDDSLAGEYGNDTYIFGVNSGNDIIYDGSGTNRIVFRDFVSTDMIVSYPTENKNNAILTMQSTGQTLTLKNFGSSSAYRNFVLEFADRTEIHAEDANSPFCHVFGTENDDTSINSVLDKTIVEGLGGNDIINDGSGNNKLYGGNGNDTINANNGDDYLDGGAGDDSLYGGYGNDYLDGGVGNDYLDGGSGNDTYVFAKESGNDIIYDASGTNRIVFRDFVSTDMIVSYPTGNMNNAVLTMQSTGQTLTLKNISSSSSYRNFVLEFADGTEIQAEDENSPLCHVVGTENDDASINSSIDKTIVEGLGGNDIINDGSGNNKLYGGNGNDTINANNGDDYLDGGAGDDVLNGGSGNDTYVFGKDSGNDVIYDGSGTNRIVFKDFVSTDMIVSYPTGNMNNAILTMQSTGQTLTFKNFCSSSAYRNFILEFADGTLMNADDKNSLFYHVVGTEKDDASINSNLDQTIVEGLGGNDVINDGNGNNKLYGGNGNDTINANNGDDYLDGGVGDDVLNGGSGNDTYIFGKESGNDVIYDGSGTNRIVFKDFVSTDMIVSYPTGNMNNAVLTMQSTGQTLTLKNIGSSSSYRNFVLEFADGTEIQAEDENSPLCHVVGTENDDASINSSIDKTIVEGFDGNDVINDGSGNNKLYGGNGNDTINANNGDDYLDGGAGDDVLNGGSGNDTYVFGKESGNDVIYDGSGTNRIVFKDFVSTDMIVSYPTGNMNNAILTMQSTGQTLTLKNIGSSSSYRNFVLEFADGTEIQAEDENSPLCHVVGTENDDASLNSSIDKTIVEGFGGNDVINDGSGNNKLYGGNGNDTINAGSGNDYIDGGAGDDVLNGGNGNDTYIFGKDSGNDVIYDGSGTNRIVFKDFVSTDMIVSYPTGNINNAILTMQSTGQTLTLKNIGSSSSYRNFVLEFADGTEIQAEDENSPLCHVVGTENDDASLNSSIDKTIVEGFGGNDVINDGSGNNKLYGGNGNDTINANRGNDYIDGGAGDDLLYGGYGNDTYIFGKESGNDIIRDNSGTNRVVFSDFVSTDMTVSYSTENKNDAILNMQSTGQMLTLKDFCYSASYRNFVIEFSDGKTGYVDYESMELIVNVEEEEEVIQTNDELIIQTNTELLDNIYNGNNVTKELTTEVNSILDLNASNTLSIEEDSNYVADMTYLQSMVLVENMSAFGSEKNVFDNNSFTNNDYDSSVIDQMLVNSQAQ